jgi:hypothetical protein
MRKSTLFIMIGTLGIFALLGACAAFAEVAIKGGVDVGGTLDVEGTDFDVDTGFSVAGEFTKSVAKIVSLGAGAEFQFPRSTESGSGTFNFIPVYALGKIQIPIPLNPYASAKVGYNFFLGNDDFKGGGSLKGGLHYGFGVGISLFKLLLAEGSYSIHNGVYESGGGDSDITYSTFSIKAGVKF